MNTLQGSFKNKEDLKKHNLFCDYYKKLGHIKERCCDIYGFPNNVKGNKDRKIATQVGGCSEFTTTTHNSMQGHLPDLIASQYKKLMSLLNESPRSPIQ